MSLAGDIAGWDGKDTKALTGLYDRHRSEADFVDRLAALIDPAETQAAATWLIKYHLEQGGSLTAAETAALLNKPMRLQRWAARLHLLQMMAHLDLAGGNRHDLHEFVTACRGDDNKFVRAWSYSGLAALAATFPEYRAELERCLDVAATNEVASVRARIRNIRKSLR